MLDLIWPTETNLIRRPWIFTNPDQQGLEETNVWQKATKENHDDQEVHNVVTHEEAGEAVNLTNREAPKGVNQDPGQYRTSRRRSQPFDGS